MIHRGNVLKESFSERDRKKISNLKNCPLYDGYEQRNIEPMMKRDRHNVPGSPGLNTAKTYVQRVPSKR